MRIWISRSEKMIGRRLFLDLLFAHWLLFLVDVVLVLVLDVEVFQCFVVVALFVAAFGGSLFFVDWDPRDHHPWVQKARTSQGLGAASYESLERCGTEGCPS